MLCIRTRHSCLRVLLLYATLCSPQLQPLGSLCERLVYRMRASTLAESRSHPPLPEPPTQMLPPSQGQKITAPSTPSASGEPLPLLARAARLGRGAGSTDERSAQPVAGAEAKAEGDSFTADRGSFLAADGDSFAAELLDHMLQTCPTVPVTSPRPLVSCCR